MTFRVEWDEWTGSFWMRRTTESPLNLEGAQQAYRKASITGGTRNVVVRELV